MTLVLPDNVDAVYMSDYNPNRMLSAQLFTPGGRHVKKFFTAEPFSARHLNEKPPLVRPVVAPQSSRRSKSVMPDKCKVNEDNGCQPNQTTFAVLTSETDVRPFTEDQAKVPRPPDQQLDVPDRPEVPKLTAASLASRINTLEPLPIAKMFDFWRSKSAEADGASNMYDTSNNTTSSPYSGSTSQPGSHHTSWSTRGSPQKPNLDKYTQWWKRKSPKQQIANPRSSPGVLANQRSVAVQQPFRSQANLTSGRRERMPTHYSQDSDIEPPQNRFPMLPKHDQERTAQNEISPPAVRYLTI